MRYILATALILGIGASGAAAANLPCGETALVLHGAKERYQEVPVYDGVTADHTPTLITVSPAGTWTMFLVRENMLCGVAVGGKHTAAIPNEKPKTSTPGIMANGLIQISY